MNEIQHILEGIKHTTEDGMGMMKMVLNDGWGICPQISKHTIHTGSSPYPSPSSVPFIFILFLIKILHIQSVIVFTSPTMSELWNWWEWPKPREFQLMILVVDETDWRNLEYGCISFLKCIDMTQMSMIQSFSCCVCCWKNDVLLRVLPSAL